MTSKTNKSGKNDKSMVSDKVFITPGAPTPKPESSRRPSTTSVASKKPEPIKKEIPPLKPSIPSPAKSQIVPPSKKEVSPERRSSVSSNNKSIIVAPIPSKSPVKEEPKK